MRDNQIKLEYIDEDTGMWVVRFSVNGEIEEAIDKNLLNARFLARKRMHKASNVHELNRPMRNDTGPHAA